MALYGHEYGEYWCLCGEQEKCRSVEKEELKNLHQFKSYGQNKINFEILSHFLCILGPKMTTLGEAFPMGPQSSSLCFWNQWNVGNGNSHRAKSNHDDFLTSNIVLVYNIIKILCGNIRAIYAAMGSNLLCCKLISSEFSSNIFQVLSTDTVLQMVVRPRLRDVSVEKY